MTSLQNLCISSIVKEFKRFFLVYKKSNDQTLKRSFEILQRKYSFELVSELWEKGKIKNKYLGFLLNDYLTVFRSWWVGQHPLKDILCRLPNLTIIEFTLIDRANDEDLKNIAKFCRKIVEIKGPIVATDDGLKYLCKNENGVFPCPELKILRHFMGITDAGVKYLLLNLPSLEYINFGNIPECLYSLHKTSLPEQDKKLTYNLIHLDFLKLDATSSQYTDILRTCLALCPKLKSIECYISHEEQLNLLNNTNLKALDICFLNNDPKFDISNFLKCGAYNLAILAVENCTMSINDLAASCPILESLHITSVTLLHNEDSQPIFHHLVDCIFSFVADDANTNKAIHNLLLLSPKLEEISFLNCDLSADTKTYVLKCCEKYSIKKILFQDTVVELNFLKVILLNCPSLRSLVMEECFPTRPFPKIPYDENVKELFDLAGKLPNKPIFYLSGIDYDDTDEYADYEDYDDDSNDDYDYFFGDGNDDDDDDDDKMDYDDEEDKMNYDDDKR